MSNDPIDKALKASLQSPVAVLYGGSSAEREVSLESGAAVLAALSNLGIDAEGIDTRDGSWIARMGKEFQHAFIALHGGEGEGGTVQAILQGLGVTFTGSDVAASALAMDKIRSKYLWQGMRLPTPGFDILTASTDWKSCVERHGKVMVKPASEGSSIGMSIATTAAELEEAYRAASQFHGPVMAERLVEGAEFTVAILGETALPAIRLETDNTFYDYEAKYLSEETRYICPCGLTGKKEKEIRALALEAFDALGCRGWGRADFMQDKKGNFYLLEVNTVPGMTSHSLVPMAARAAAIDFDSLVARILQLSLTQVQS